MNYKKRTWEKEQYIPPLHSPLTTREIYRDKVEQAAAFRQMKEAYKNGVKPKAKSKNDVTVISAAEKISKNRDKAFNKAVRRLRYSFG